MLLLKHQHVYLHFYKFEIWKVPIYKKSLNEFNQNFKISLPKNLRGKSNNKMNDDGYINFEANLEKMSKYSFRTISKFSNFEPEILLDENHLF